MKKVEGEDGEVKYICKYFYFNVACTYCIKSFIDYMRYD